MGGGCCAETSSELKALRKRHASVLWVVLAVNASMFIVELVAGMLAKSTSLLADSLDMFGDASVYALSLFVLSRSERWRASAALVKGGLMLLFGLAVLGQAVWRVWHPELPDSETMGAVGTVALAANLACFALLYRHRGDDLNMRSTWLCSRNDVVANLAVILAAGATWFTASRWPDLVVGSGIALLFVSSALGVIGEGRIALGVPAAASTGGAPR
jgi:cation diffusion facilitator family transporter